jgi:hypothetical protein
MIVGSQIDELVGCRRVYCSCALTGFLLRVVPQKLEVQNTGPEICTEIESGTRNVCKAQAGEKKASPCNSLSPKSYFNYLIFFHLQYKLLQTAPKIAATSITCCCCPCRDVTSCQKKIWLRFVCQHAKQAAKLFVFVFV